MSTDNVEPEPSNDPANRKSFWEHLADLRKALIRSSIAVGIGVIVCLFLDSHLVSILEYPLRRIDMFEKAKPTVSFKIGDTKLGPYPIKPEQFAGLPPGTAPRVVFQVGTAQIGQEQVVTVKLEPQADEGATLRVRLHNFSPPEAFVIAFHVALYGAFILAAPFWIYYLGGFILPALHVHERRLLFR
jgi:sec-independent protein translocase protein TatC